MSQADNSEGKACPQCLLHHQCVCDWLPSINAPFHLALLTHENELKRDTNTGQWLDKCLSATSVHIWQRTQPCDKLLAMLESQRYQAYLLFPSDDSVAVATAIDSAQQQRQVPLFIILDGTWQEAKKMLRQSPWLKALPMVHINPDNESRYPLRRNQQPGHLCTLEVGSEILKESGQAEQAKQLVDFFDHYMLAFKADKSGHALATKKGA